VPGYPAVLAALPSAKSVHSYDALAGGKARIVVGHAHGMDLIVLDAPHLFGRPGNPYLGPDGKDWTDNAARFSALARVAVDIGRGAISGYQPQVLHLHDWQAALAAVEIFHRGGPATVLTVHNIAFHGQFPASVFAQLNLPQSAFSIDGLEYYGDINFLKGGLMSADAITTVSPTYAQEICTADFGMGLDGVLRDRRDVLTGIVNGIDTDAWNPLRDPLIATPYGHDTLDKRKGNKRVLEGKFGLDADEGILHGVVSRMTQQKGIDILAQLLDWLVESGARLALIGTGDAAIESAFVDAAKRHVGRIGVALKYDEGLAHLVQAGADTMLVPSRFEPCGLTQLYGLRYGCVPIVARTGGLADTVIDANEAAVAAGVATGFQFLPVDEFSLQSALARAANSFSNPNTWRLLQRNGMTSDVSWDRSAAQYAAVYAKVAAN
jgi:starch synthase